MKISERTLRSWTLPFSILCGIFLHNYLYQLKFLTPYILFCMMFFTCSKISLKELKLSKMHLYLVLFQLVVGPGIYFLVRPYSEIVAQGLMMCVMSPVATASPVVGALLGADVALMTSYVFVSNIVIAIVIPPLMSFLNSSAEISYLATMWHVAKSSLSILIIPLILSWLSGKYTPKVSEWTRNHSMVSFYLWGSCMMILIGGTIHSMATNPAGDRMQEIFMIIGALVIALVLFPLGAWFGTRCGDKVAGRQMMAQKNTGIGLWLTMQFLDPLCTVAPAAYIIWQNLINSYEIFKGTKNQN